MRCSAPCVPAPASTAAFTPAMQAPRRTAQSQTTCTESGVITLRNLPIYEGGSVDVVVIPRSLAASVQDRYPLRGEPVEYIRPFEPVAGNDWEATQ